MLSRLYHTYRLISKDLFEPVLIFTKPLHPDKLAAVGMVPTSDCLTTNVASGRWKNELMRTTRLWKPILYTTKTLALKIASLNIRVPVWCNFFARGACMSLTAEMVVCFYENPSRGNMFASSPTVSLHKVSPNRSPRLCWSWICGSSVMSKSKQDSDGLAAEINLVSQSMLREATNTGIEWLHCVN